MHTLSAEDYTDPAIFQKERSSIFLREWIPIAHMSEFLEPQYALERTFDTYSIVLVRENDIVRAFHNVCPHRAGPLLWEQECTALKALRCRYHGWRYDLEGTCTHQPDFGTNVQAQLQSIHVQQWEGLVFISLSPNPPDFHWSELLNQHVPSLLHFELHRTARHRLQCNWKTYVENYLEGYHIPYLHPSLRSSIQMSQYKIHCYDTIITHEVPTKEDSGVSGFWAYFWPLTAINMYGSSMSIEQIVPVGLYQTDIHYIYLSKPDTSADQREAAIAMSKEVTEEDITICNAVAQNLRSGIYTKGYLSPKHEQGLHHMYTLRSKAML